ncbi:hypothetical protein QCA50_019182 [Cerrena zonata]|uniref:Protein kinase domain-containing protein n=1 Tax=Cerrena zonata TaxID=2478898 RepID=A0AAW0FFL4_9APHY
MPITKRPSPNSSPTPPSASPKLEGKTLRPSMASHSSSTPIAPPLSSSNSSSTVKISSPLNPSSPPSRSPALPSIPAPTPPSRPDSPSLLDNSGISNRKRGGSVSTIRPDHPHPIASTHSLPVSSPASSDSVSPADSTASLPLPIRGARPRGRHHSTPSRSISPRRHSPAQTSALRHHVKGSETPPNGVPSTWWGSREPQARPWPWDETPLARQRRLSLTSRGSGREASPARSVELSKHAAPSTGSGWTDFWGGEKKEKKTIPEEQLEGWVRTRGKILHALSATLDTTLDVTHDVLELSVDLLEFVPVVGLEPAARTLLTIWDAVQMVDMNRLACLRLTERCADILISVQEEILETGERKVGKELESAVERLVAAFSRVHILLKKQAHRPFLKRYLKRDEIQRELAGCDQALEDALNMFSVSIQIRILKQVLKAEEQRQLDVAAIMERLNRTSAAPVGSPSHSNAPAPRSIANALQLANTPHDDSDPHTYPLHLINTLRLLQNERDSARDTVELRQLMRSALQTNNDMEMIKVLQVGRDEMPEAIKTLQRALEVVVEKERVEDEAIAFINPVPTGGSGGSLSRSSTISSSGSSSSISKRSRSSKDTLDREFMESGIESLRRLSTSGGATTLSLPSWTITRYEVDREEKIGIGFFSDVYRGRWRDRVVAIKVLAESTPRQLFIHEVSIWKTLKHPNVVELLGASSTTGDPPWFFVSPYYRNGSLIKYLKAQPSLDNVDVLRMIHQVARGMAYLHGKGVLHGDLKGANILVDDSGHCVITDFGQSELRSEVYRLSGTPLPHGTLRWQAPELMWGQSQLTQQVDVYAFAMVCVEILTKGGLPWPLVDDDTVRHFVLRENMRPEIPLQRAWSTELNDILRACWNRVPAQRPLFAKVDGQIQALRSKYVADVRDSPMSPTVDLDYDPLRNRKSPPMHPVDLPLLPPDMFFNEPSPSFTDGVYETASEGHSDGLSLIHEEGTPTIGGASHTVSPTKSRQSSLRIHTPSTESDYDFHHGNLGESGYESPLPADDAIASARNERRYRMLLQHEYHPSLTLPLWTPSNVSLGAVGYHSKPDGAFITLFNSFKPPETSNHRADVIPSLYGYGRVNQGSQKLDKRNVAQKGMDIIQAWITAKSKGDGQFAQAVSRRYSSPLRTGHKAAHLFTESALYRYIEDLATPKAWFKANIDHILDLYGAEHNIQKEDLYLVIGTLDAPDYALFVSHNHPDGQVNFNVFSSPKTGSPWGEFSTSNELASSMLGGPIYTEEAPGYQSANKVSEVRSGGKSDTILLARLRFPPDRSEPTSL